MASQQQLCQTLGETFHIHTSFHLHESTISHKSAHTVSKRLKVSVLKVKNYSKNCHRKMNLGSI